MSARASASEVPEPDRLEGWPHPRESHHLFGHHAAEQTLLNAVNGRMPHAWILGGPRGLGKATLAYRLAKALLARGAGTQPLASLDTDPDHPAVRRVTAAAHSDLLVLKRPYDHKTGKLKNDLNVEEVRRLADFFQRHAGEGGPRIALVDAADDLNRNAANALLKTLEEPPKNGLLILLAHAPRALLPTIRSRCRMLLMKPLGPEDMAQGLGLIAPDLEDRDVLAATAGGSIGAALEMAALDAPGLDRTLANIQKKHGRDAGAAHGLANELATPAAAPRFRLFLDRIQTAFAAEAGQGSKPALDAWHLATSLARAEENLHIDKRAVVLRLLDRYAAL